MKRIIILTGSELRHGFMRKAMALHQDIKVIASYCEGTEKSLLNRVTANGKCNDNVEMRHVIAREQSEKDFFEPFSTLVPDRSNPLFLKKEAINDPEYVKTIIESDPDFVVVYGSSIIKEPLLSAFKQRIINVHLGLSPYYRGSGTNFWALVNGELEFVGATFMHLDANIDTGKILHQMRARIFPNDTPHQIGNRLITDVAKIYPHIIRNWDKMEKVSSIACKTEKAYKRKDFNAAAVNKLYSNFRNKIVEKYLSEMKARCQAAPIIINPTLEATKTT